MDMEKLRRLTPLITEDDARFLGAMRQSPHAPQWNSHAGDMLSAGDILTLKRFRQGLERRPERSLSDGPSDALIAAIHALRPTVLAFMERLHEGMDLRRDWALVGLTSREDIALRPETLIPMDLPLDRMVVYRTAGTTGHSLYVPNDPVAVGCYQPMMEFALARHGAAFNPAPGSVACFLVGAQARTVTYPTVLSYWKGAGFAKLNLNPGQWPQPQSPDEYFAQFPPMFLTGDPISFAHLMKMGIQVKPSAMITTAVAMSQGLKKTLATRFNCPVIDWYSLTETGPIAYACPKGDGYHLLSDDLYTEVVDAEGRPLPAGVRGEIAVTGGRNPFLPLLRYRTGDFGAMEFGPCPCGDAAPRLTGMEGRKPVLFKRSDGSIVNPVDISTALREFPIVQSEFSQEMDLTCRLVIRPLFPSLAAREGAIRRAVAAAMGEDIPLTVEFDPNLGDRQEGKTMPFRSGFLLED
jgi:phenylacetate-CoA ligase